MRLVNYRSGNIHRAGLVVGDRVVELIGDRTEGDLDAVISDPAALERLRRDADGALSRPGIPLADVELTAPIRRPGKIVAIGLNYVDHAREGKVEVPAEPLVFTKFRSSIVGPGAAIEWDRSLTDCVDYEAELAVVIARPARRVSVADALDHVFGYTCLNDISARDLQFSDGQWVRAKSLDTFCPIGPWLVTPDELPDPQALQIECEVSGTVLQSATTADMYFTVAEVIAWLSHSFTLEPGDLIATGTPPGVGYFRSPQRLLKSGDTVTVRIESIGALTNVVRSVGTPRPVAEA